MSTCPLNIVIPGAENLLRVSFHLFFPLHQRLAKLGFVKFGVNSTVVYQFRMGTPLHNGSVLDNQNFIRCQDGGKTVCN